MSVDTLKHSKEILGNLDIFLTEEELDDEAIRDIAQLLYELKFKEELLVSIEKYSDVLYRTTWIESQEDMIEIKQM